MIGPTSSLRRGIETRMAHARIAFGFRTRAISLISSRCASSNESAAMRASSLLVDSSVHSQCRNRSRLSARWERSCRVPETSSPLVLYMTWLHPHRQRLTSDLETSRRQSERRYAYRRHRPQQFSGARLSSRSAFQTIPTTLSAREGWRLFFDLCLMVLTVPRICFIRTRTYWNVPLRR